MRLELNLRHLLLALHLAVLLGFAWSQPSSTPLRIGVVLPTEVDAGTDTNPLAEAVQASARMGVVMAEEEFSFNAELLGMTFEVLLATAADAEAAAQAAERLVTEEGVFALVGGFDEAQALALSEVAERHEVPFLNIGSPSDVLRNEACNRYTFHVQPSAAMYLDALAGWFVRAGFREWFFVYEDTATGEALYDRAEWTLRERHFGAREVGSVALPEGAGVDEALDAIRRAEPEVVLLLLEPQTQLAFLGAFEEAGFTAAVTGFPYPATQTRTFFAASLDAASEAGSGHRATAWEATLDAYGARELNVRFAERWGEPMDSPAWAAYQAIKILFEAASFGGTTEGEALVEYLGSPESVFDVWKGIGVTFRPWDHQLRQPLYLVGINEGAEGARDLATLVGELPAIYMPRTDPVERLDQLGDLERQSECRF